MTSTGRPEVLALIPARGGSKGIPRKNVMLLGGKPLIAHSIEHARASRHVTRVVVSTDDDEIAGIAREWGAEVPFRRPVSLAQDLSTDLEVFRHALQTLEGAGYRCDLVVHLRPTAPVRRVALIDQAIESMLAHPDADALRSVSTPKHTPYKMWRASGEYIEPLLTMPGVDEAHSQPRQELPEVFWQNGYVDIVRPRVVLEWGMMAGHRVLPFLVDDPVPELDYPEDVPRLEEALAGRGGLAASNAPSKRHPV